MSPSTFQVFTPAYAYIDATLDEVLDEGVTRMAAEVAGPLKAAVVLYVLLYGIAILRGAINEPIVDFAVRSIKLALIQQLATTAAYSDWITDPLFHSLPATIARGVTGHAGDSAGVAFDQFIDRAFFLGQSAIDTATLRKPDGWIVGGSVYLFSSFAAALGFGIVVLAKVALALIITLGPVFVACALFEATRRYFFGWLSQAVNYIILFALIIAIFQFVLALVANQWDAIAADDPIAGGLIFIVLCLLGAIFFLQTPAMAAGIAGGASAGLADFGNAVGLRSHRHSSAEAAPRQSGRGGGAPTGSIQRRGGR